MSRLLTIVSALIAVTSFAYGCGGSSKNTTGTTTSAAVQPGGSTTASTPSQTPALAEPTAALVPPVKVKIASGTPLSRTDWIARGDAICTHLDEQLAATKVKYGRELSRVLPQAAAYEQAEVAQLAKLVPPRSRAADWQEFLDDAARGARGSAKLAEYSNLGGGIAKTPLASTLIQLRARTATIAKGDGFKVCSQL